MWEEENVSICRRIPSSRRSLSLTLESSSLISHLSIWIPPRLLVTKILRSQFCREIPKAPPGSKGASAHVHQILFFFLVFLSGEICSKLRGSNNVLALLKPKRASKKGPKATAGRAADRQRDEKDENTVYDSCPWPERMDGQALAHKNGLDGQTRTPLHVVTRTSGSS